MNLMRTAMLLAFMTALFMGVGFLIGGKGGMMIALVIAAGMNLFSYWNSDKMVLAAYRAREVDERNAPEFLSYDPRPIAECRAANAEGLCLRQSQPNAFANGP